MEEYWCDRHSNQMSFLGAERHDYVVPAAILQPCEFGYHKHMDGHLIGTNTSVTLSSGAAEA